MIFTAKIEQTYAYPKQMKYFAETDSFIEKDCGSLSYVRGVASRTRLDKGVGNASAAAS